MKKLIVFTTLLLIMIASALAITEVKLIDEYAYPTYLSSYVIFTPTQDVYITNTTIHGAAGNEPEAIEWNAGSWLEIRSGGNTYYTSSTHPLYGQYKTNNDGAFNAYKLTYSFGEGVFLNASTTYQLVMVNATIYNGMRRGGDAIPANDWNIKSGSNTDIYVWFFGYTCLEDWACDGYAACDIEDEIKCNSAVDNNVCGNPYTGDYTEFGVTSCDYCTPSFSCTDLSECQLKPTNIKICSEVTDANDCYATTGLSSKQFSLLVVIFAKYLEEAKLEKYKDKNRKIGSGKKGDLETADEKLLFILYYLKCYPTFDVLGFTFGISGDAAHRYIYSLFDILVKSLNHFGVLPYTEFNSPEELQTAFSKVDTLLIDATEHVVQRSQDYQVQKDNQSGKKNSKQINAL